MNCLAFFLISTVHNLSSSRSKVQDELIYGIWIFTFLVIPAEFNNVFIFVF